MSRKDSKQGKNKQKQQKGPLGGGPKPGTAVAKAIKARELEKQLDEGERLWGKGDVDGALDLLDDLVERFPRDPRALILSAVIYSELGDKIEALDRAEIAESIAPQNPIVLQFLALIYLTNQRIASSLQILRRLRILDPGGEFFDKDSRAQFQLAEQVVRQEAGVLNVPPATFEQCMLLTEQGEAATLHGDFVRGIDLLGQAIKLIPNWLPPRLNQTVFMWQAGQAEESIQTCLKMVEDGYNSVELLAQLLTTLVWSGQTDRARQFLPQLEQAFATETAELATADEAERDALVLIFYKAAGVYGSLGEDQRVYDILRQGEQAELEYINEEWLWLAIASYNLGRPDEAQIYWQKIELEQQSSFDMGLRQTITRPMPADAPEPHLPYFETTIYVPIAVLEQLLVLKDSSEAETKVEFDTEQLRLNYDRLSRFYPIMVGLTQNAKFANALTAETNVGIIGEIHNDEAVAVLKDLALGYLGAEDARSYAVSHLIKWGELAPDAQIRFWVEQSGEWQELPVSTFETMEQHSARRLKQMFNIDVPDLDDEDEE